MDLLPRHQGFLQIGADLNRLGGVAQLHGQGLVVQTGVGEFVRLLDKRLLEPALEVLGHLAGDSAGVVVVNQIALRVGVDRHLAFGADDLGRVLLPMGHHARAVKVGDFSTVELDNADRIVVVVVLFQLGLDSDDAMGRDTLGDDVVSQEPQGQIDVVHRHVDKHSAGPRRVLDVEAGRIVLVAGLAPDDGRPADQALADFVECVAVRIVEAAGEAAHHLQMWPFSRFGDHLSALQAVSQRIHHHHRHHHSDMS